MFSVLVADYDPTLPLPVSFTCRFYVGAQRAQRHSRVNIRTIRLTCPVLFTTCSYILTFLSTLALFTDAHICIYIYIIYIYIYSNITLYVFLDFLRQAGNQNIKRARKAKLAPPQARAVLCSFFLFLLAKVLPMLRTRWHGRFVVGCAELCKVLLQVCRFTRKCSGLDGAQKVRQKR